MNAAKRRRMLPAYQPPPDAPPLADVVRDLFTKGKQLNEYDDRLSMSIAKLERILRERGVSRITGVKLPDGAELGWSYTRRGNRWRFVIRDEEEAVELMSCTREERCEVFTCGAMEKLIDRLLAP